MEQKCVEADAVKKAEKVPKPKKSTFKVPQPQVPQPHVPQPQGNIRMDGNVFCDAVVNAVGDTIRDNQKRTNQQPAPTQAQQRVCNQHESKVSEPTPRGKLKGGQYIPQVTTAVYNRPLNSTPLHQRFRDANQNCVYNTDFSQPPPSFQTWRPNPERDNRDNRNEGCESDQNYGHQQAPAGGPPDKPGDDSSDETSINSRGKGPAGNGNGHNPNCQ